MKKKEKKSSILDIDYSFDQIEGIINLGSSKKIRPAALASMFYPGNSEELRDIVQTYLKGDINEQKKNINQKFDILDIRVLIVPHAGYIYSGAIAASAYRLLQQNGNCFKRVFLLGPAHRFYVKGAAFPNADIFETPLGKINLEIEIIEKMLQDFSYISVSEKVHAEEHCLEVQLPFLQETLHEFKLIPLIVGETKTENISEIIQQFGEDQETLIVISTDLSHFYDYQTAKLKDSCTAKAIKMLSPEKISTEDACGAYPLRGALAVAKQNKWNVHQLGICNSGDTAGDFRRVVGYGAWVISA